MVKELKFMMLLVFMRVILEMGAVTGTEEVSHPKEKFTKVSSAMMKCMDSDVSIGLMGNSSRVISIAERRWGSAGIFGLTEKFTMGNSKKMNVTAKVKNIIWMARDSLELTEMAQNMEKENGFILMVVLFNVFIRMVKRPEKVKSSRQVISKNTRKDSNLQKRRRWSTKTFSRKQSLNSIK